MPFHIKILTVSQVLQGFFEVKYQNHCNYHKYAAVLRKPNYHNQTKWGNSGGKLILSQLVIERLYLQAMQHSVIFSCLKISRFNEQTQFFMPVYVCNRKTQVKQTRGISRSWRWWTKESAAPLQQCVSIFRIYLMITPKPHERRPSISCEG